MTVLQKDLHTK